MICRLVLCLSLILTCAAASADSQLPDDDISGRNNSFEKAIDAGVLGEVQNGARRSYSSSEQLGIVIGKFDTVDYYRFSLPAGKWRLTVAIKETPITTQWFEVFDAAKRQLHIEKGGDNDTATLTLDGGIYYVRVETDTATAAGRNLKYDISIVADLIPNDDTGGQSCAGAENWGKLPFEREVRGTLSSSRNRSFYKFYYPFEMRLVAGRWENDSAEVVIFDGYGGKSWKVVHRNNVGDTLDPLILDPGFYCMAVVDDYATALPKNYRVKLGRHVGQDYALRDTKEKAGYIAIDDIGPIVRNGEYKYKRQKKEDTEHPGPQLTIGTEYYTREWVGTNRQAHWYQFELQTPAAITLFVTGLLSSAGVERQNAAGVILSRDPPSGTPPFPLQTRRVHRDLSAGTYFVRIFNDAGNDPGTSFQLMTKISPPGTPAGN